MPPENRELSWSSCCTPSGTIWASLGSLRTIGSRGAIGPSPRTTTVSRKIVSSSPAASGWTAPVPSGSCTGTCARSSQPSGPSTSSMMPPCWVMPEAISSRTSPQMPSFLGAAKACSWTALSRSTTVAATIASPATSTRSSMPSTPGTKMPPRSTRPSPGFETSEMSHGPSGRGAGGRFVRREPFSAPVPSSSSATCSASRASSAVSSAEPLFLRRPNTSTSFPVGYDRSVAVPTLGVTARDAVHRGVAAGGSEAPLGPRRAGEFRHLVEAHLLDLLDDQLGNPVEPFEPHGLAWIEIDHDDLDLPTVPGIDRPWGVHEGHSAAGGEAGAGVHEGGVPVGQGDRHPGGEHRPFARGQLRGLGGDQVGTGVTGVSVAGDRHVRVDPADEYVDGVAHQGFT